MTIPPVVGKSEFNVTPRRAIWTTEGPTSWPLAPALMSYTALREIETCPLRWGLRHGEYVGLWSGRGYPPSHATATMAGHVVHLTLERIVSAAAAAAENDPDAEGCEPATHIVAALRSLGGISAVLERVIRDTVAEWATNPRLQPRLRELAIEMQRRLPALRPRVQHFLNRIDVSRLRHRSTARTDDGDAGADGHTLSGPMTPGLHAEVPLTNEGLGWYGKADLLWVGSGEEGDEIVDFKTGQPKPDHALQLRIYALLWARDRQRNPTRRRARTLTVLYDAGPTDVLPPITDVDLESVVRELSERTTQARASMASQPPIAKPSVDACQWCDVRHMCQTYWTSAPRAAVASSAVSRDVVDAGVKIIRQQGTWSWIAIVTELGALSEHLSVSDRVLLRARQHDDHIASLISAGDQLRVVGSQYVASSEESGGLAVLSLLRSTEVFLHGN